MSQTTNRPISAGMEPHLDTYYSILDHGFIAVKDYMGDDASILSMARMSYGKGTTSLSDNRGLLRYLMRNSHTSPFEGCVIKLHVKMPIFVMRQWVRHRTASLNEYSARYSIMPDDFYMPASNQLARQSTDNKQGRGELLGPDEAAMVLRLLKDGAEDSLDRYHKLLSLGATQEEAEADGVDGLARELARIGLPVSIYTQIYWQINLHNLLHFLKLRVDGHSQYEIRVYAEKILEILADWVPMTAEAFRDYQLESAQLSRMELALLRDMLAGKASLDNAADYGLSKREVREFSALIDPAS